MQPPLPPEGLVTPPDGAQLFYRQQGERPPVVLPNGFHLLEDLSPLASRYTLIAYDLRHRGLSLPS